MSDKIKFLDQLVFVKNGSTTTQRIFFDINTNGDLEIRGPGTRDFASHPTTTTSTGGLRVYADSTFVGQLTVDGLINANNGIYTPPGITSTFSKIVVGISSDPVTTEVLTVQGSLRVTGNVAVAGTVTNTSQQNLLVTDNIIVLNNGETGAGVTIGSAGILIDRGTSSTAALQFVESSFAWDLNYPAKKTSSSSTTTLPTNPRIINVGTPTGANDASTKNYVDVALTNISLDNLTDVVISSPTLAQVLRYNGTSWVNAKSNFVDLNDVGTPLNNGYLKWTTGVMTYVTTIPSSSVTGLSNVAKSGQGSLAWLTDVSSGSGTITPSSGQVLKYDGTTWSNYTLAFTELSGTPSNGTYTFVGLNDTNNTVVNSGFLRWNSGGTQIDYQATIATTDITGLASVATTGNLTSLANILDVVLTSPANGDLLSYDNSLTKWKNITPTYVQAGANISIFTNDAGYLTTVNLSTHSIGELSDVDITTSAPTTGQTLVWNGTKFAPVTPPSGVTTFIGLSDVPSSYSGQGTNLVRVNTSATALEFVAAPSPYSAITSDLIPAADSTYKIGSSSPARYWTDVFTNNIKVQTILPKNSLIGSGSGSSSSIGSATLPFDTAYIASVQGYSADLAERYESDAIYPIGTLVKIGGDKEITITSKYLDRDTFGVICDSPAYGMNSWAGTQDTHPYVAMVGRIQVLIDGVAKKGQRLVTGKTPGTAIAVDYDKGWINQTIGRVLQDKDTYGVGLTLCVVQVKI